jgi:hypothetical protein
MLYSPVSNPRDGTGRVVLCFDRDHTVSVNGHPEHAAVPIGWIQYWAHETAVPVWATGNQHLKSEAGIPGLSDAESLWTDCLNNGAYEYENSEFENHVKPRRRDGLRLIRDVYEATFPAETFRFVVVDDVDVSDLAAEGPWTHYFPWEFVSAVETGSLAASHGVTEPPADSYRNDGVPFNSTDSPDFERQDRTVTELEDAADSSGSPDT